MAQKTTAINSNDGVLIIDDDVALSEMLSLILNKSGYKTFIANNGQTGISLFHKESPSAVLLDLRMPGMDGMEVLKQIKLANGHVPVIIMTAYGKIQSVVEAVKLGAHDYVTKPFANEEIVLAVQRAIHERAMRQEINTLKTQLNLALPLFEQMGSSTEIAKINELVERVAPTGYTVVLYGETGTGKEVVARNIHDRSPRKSGPFVVVDCGSIPETLIESEFFGYEKGAFTGADQKKMGQFEMASGGTIFLDEIGNLPLSMQSKLLRVLQERRFRCLGGSREIGVDVRVVAAGNERLESLVKTGRFRMDLYQRLNEFCIEVPPLRQRKDDVVFLCKKFLDVANAELGKRVIGFSKEALEAMTGYDWPGNVRELKNVVRRSALLAADTIEMSHLPADFHKKSLESAQLAGSAPGRNASGTGVLTERVIPMDFDVNDENLSLHDVVAGCVEGAERRLITEVMKQTGGNKRRAARILKIDYKTMFYKCKKYGI